MPDINMKRKLESLKQHKSIIHRWKWNPSDAERKQNHTSPIKRKGFGG